VARSARRHSSPETQHAVEHEPGPDQPENRHKQ
jgi:hypothetical protein